MVDILKEVGWKRDLVNDWFEKHGDLFMEWLEDAMMVASRPIKDLLTQVGNERAMGADGFQYWKELARTHGVISAEKTETELSVGALTRGLDKLTPAELSQRANAMLSQARTLEHSDNASLAGAVDDERPRGDSDGAGALQVRPVALPDASRDDRECEE